jgi:hypothetical protein
MPIEARGPTFAQSLLGQERFIKFTTVYLVKTKTLISHYEDTALISHYEDTALILFMERCQLTSIVNEWSLVLCTLPSTWHKKAQAKAATHRQYDGLLRSQY